MSVRCLNDKGTVVFIPEKLAAMPDYMRRNKLVIDEIKPQEELKPLTEVNLKVEKPQEVVDDSPIVEITEELTKEEYWAILDEKGIEYKKTYGINKLKELTNVN
jgi:LysM repeat protein